MLHGSSSRAWVLDKCHAFSHLACGGCTVVHPIICSMHANGRAKATGAHFHLIFSDFCYYIWNFYFHAGYSFFSCLTTIFWIYIWYLKFLPILDHLFYVCLLIRQFSKSFNSLLVHGDDILNPDRAILISRLGPWTTTCIHSR